MYSQRYFDVNEHAWIAKQLKLLIPARIYIIKGIVTLLGLWNFHRHHFLWHCSRVKAKPWLAKISAGIYRCHCTVINVRIEANGRISMEYSEEQLQHICYKTTNIYIYIYLKKRLLCYNASAICYVLSKLAPCCLIKTEVRKRGAMDQESFTGSGWILLLPYVR